VGLLSETPGSPASPLCPLGLYIAVMAFYHMTEFLSIGIKNPDQVSVYNFILAHSFYTDRPTTGVYYYFDALCQRAWEGFEYHFGMMASFVEFFAGIYLFGPEYKLGLSWNMLLGLGICVCSEAIRKTAILTAGKSFNHVVQHKRNA